LAHRHRLLLAVLALAALLPLGVWSIAVEPGRLAVTEVELAPARWPRGRPPLRIAALSDVHAGAPHVDEAKLRLVVDSVNAREPDLVVLLGDYVIHGVLGGRVMSPERIAHELSRLRARHGVLAVLGNHDHWLGATRVRRAFAAAGIPLIDDRALRVDAPDGAFWVAGIPDLWTGWPNLNRLLAGVPEDAALIAITHNPDIFPYVPARVSLVLAGHTHGGQVRLPLLGAPIVPSSFGQRFARGNVVENGRHLFVTSGLGTSILPLRLGVAPEIAVVTLRSLPE
jgi:predicted MPP superfamily phosphohydrolase